MIDKNIITFSETDIKVLDSFTEDEIKEYIDFFKEFKEVMWLNSDTNELITNSEYNKTEKFHSQPIPQYPKELLKLGQKFYLILEDEELYLLIKECKIDRENLLSQCTFLTPTQICVLFSSFYDKERFFDGLLGIGVEDNIYLKMLLHLEDCIRLYHHSV